jgi:quercetin dioxygenase-like cupin family protein
MKTTGLVVQAGQGPVWHMSPGRSATLKLLSGETDESVMIFEETAPPGTTTGFHIHHNSDEIAYVLSGEFTFKIGDQIAVGGSGTCAFIPRGVPHAWKNTGAETGRTLFMYTPASAGNWFEELCVAEHPIDSMSDHERVEFNQRHGWERVGPSPF